MKTTKEFETGEVDLVLYESNTEIPKTERPTDKERRKIAGFVTLKFKVRI